MRKNLDRCPCGSRYCTNNPPYSSDASASNRKMARKYRKDETRRARRTEDRKAISFSLANA